MISKPLSFCIGALTILTIVMIYLPSEAQTPNPVILSVSPLSGPCPPRRFNIATGVTSFKFCDPSLNAWSSNVGGTNAVSFIASQSLAGVATVTFSSISGSFTHLQMKCIARGVAVANTETIDIRFNGDSTLTYGRQFLSTQSTSVVGGTETVGTAGVTSIKAALVPAANQTANYAGMVRAEIPYYAGSTFFKAIEVFSWAPPPAGTGAGEFTIGGTWAATPAAITSITVLSDSGSNFATGSTCSLYGIN